MATLLVSGLLTYSILFFTGAEGIVCLCMALPLLMTCTGIGAWLGYKLRGQMKDVKKAPPIGR